MTRRDGPLRILQVDSSFEGGGTDRQALELAAGLRELGEEVSLAVPRDARWAPLVERAGLARWDVPRRSPAQSGLVARCARAIRELRVRIVHAHQGRDYWPAVAAAALAGGGCRVLVTRHLIAPPSGFSRRWLLHAADVVAVSRAVEAVLARSLRGPRARLHQIYGGIDVAAFAAAAPAGAALRARLGWPEGAPAFGVVGAFHPPQGKGQPLFLEAAARVARAHPGARFALVGAGVQDAALRARIEALGLGAATAVLPFTDAIAEVMNALDVLVHPALGSEALGLVVWEALAAGKPVIASRLDGLPEALADGEHGVLVPPGDGAALAEAMAALARDPERRTRLGEAGRAFVREHRSRRAQALRYQDLYRRLLARRP
jgi:glycosyltransferase involved in cell wall biosynthesis